MNSAIEIRDAVYAQLLARARPRPIHDETEHARALQSLTDLDERDDLSAEEEALAEVLTVLIEDYEERQYPMPSVPPHQSLRSLMEDRGLTHKDVWPVLGNKGSATEILTGRRSISKAQAKRLAAFFRVPVEIFL